ncbi:MAG: hypothetical protein ACRD1N_03525 [Terriglobia bacterium]
MSTSGRKRIAIFPALRLSAEQRLLDALAEIFPVEFTGEDEIGFESADAAIFFPEQAQRAKEAFERGVSSFAFQPSPAPSATLTSTSAVSFSGDARIHPAFRNAQISPGGDTAASPLAPGSGDTVLASHDGAALWAFRASSGVEMHSAALPPPHLNSGELLWSHLQPGSWMRILPLLHFLRGVTAEIDWAAPAQRACFIFDDPNLHSRRYGYMDFAKLAGQASEHNYHVALATIPIDACYAAPKAVELFQRHSRWLSLLIHGNDHVRNELSRDLDETEALRVVAQALARIARFERRTGLNVARVVAAPHGACAEYMMAQMLRFPLQGACISVPSVLRWNLRTSWPASFGLQPASIMAGGFPVVHRFNLRHGLLPARFAAFLGQPIVPYGHHQDCAAGLGRLAEIADAVNSWGPTEWCGFDALFGGLCRTRREGELLHVEVWGRHAEVEIPTGVSQVVLHSPEGGERECELVASRNGAAPQACPVGAPVAVAPASSVRLRIHSVDPVDLAIVGRRGFRLWPPLRRSLAIGRDRLLPIVRGAGA